MKPIKKIITSILLTVFLFASLMAAPTKTTHAVWYNQDFNEWQAHVYDSSNPTEIFGERYTAAQVQWIVYSLIAMPLHAVAGSPDYVSCLLTGDLSACYEGATGGAPSGHSLAASIMNTNGPQKSVPSQILAGNSTLSGIGYLKNTIQKLNPVHEAQAQETGFGYEGLAIIRKMWQTSRDFSYGLFVVITIIFAFMIMFRVKLNPQTVISIQSALPKIFIGLILVTFSYAIAGFLVDLMYVVYGLISLFLTSGEIYYNPLGDTSWNHVFTLMTQGPYISFRDTTLVSTGIYGFVALNTVLVVIISLIALVTSVGVIASAIIGAITLAVVSATGGAVLIIIGIIAIVIVIIMLWLDLKIIFMLIKAFASILLLTIFAPIQITLGIINPNIGFGSWVRNFAANLAVFPVTSLLFMLSFTFLFRAWDLITEWNGISDFLAGLTVGGGVFDAVGGTNSWPPLLTGDARGLLPLVYVGVSISITLIIPKAAEMIKAVVAGKPFYGLAIGDVTQAGTKPVFMGASGYTKSLENAGGLTPSWAQMLRSGGFMK